MERKLSLFFLQMESLCVDENLIGDSGATSLASCLHNTNHLLMRNCMVGSPGADRLAEKLSLLRQPVIHVGVFTTSSTFFKGAL